VTHRKAIFKIATVTGDASVEGIVSGWLGLHGGDRHKNIWTVTHLPTGRKILIINCPRSEAIERIERAQEKLKIPWSEKDLPNKIDASENQKLYELLGGTND